jgi:hypothetical protein
MKYQYYYNTLPNAAPTRNNLIYTSLMSTDYKVFVQWFHNDTTYHHGKNEVIDPGKMEEKWMRELNYINHITNRVPELVPIISEIDLVNKKIYLEVDGPDFWQQANYDSANYSTVLPDWEDQMLRIIQTHRNLGLYKYSLHPSSYFIVNGKLKSINYFFCHSESEGPLVLSDYSSHIYSARQSQMQQYVEQMGISWNAPTPQKDLQKLCLDSFRTNFPSNFIEKAKAIYD